MSSTPTARVPSPAPSTSDVNSNEAVAGAPVVVDKSIMRFLETPDIPMLGAKKLSPRQRWNVPMTEPLLATAKCYVFKFNMPQWAKLYVFGHRVCFRTLLSVGPLKVSDSKSFDEIDHVEGEDGLVLNSLRVVCKDGSKIYFAFEQPEDRVRILALCSKLLEKHAKSVVTLTPGQPSSASFESVSESEDADDDDEDPLKLADTASVNASLQLAPASSDNIADRINLRILKTDKPKHLTIFTIGSRGDVQPFISLSKTLMKRGYKVRIASFAEYKTWVESHGIEFRPVAGDATAIMSLCVDNGMFTFKFIKEGMQQLDWIKNLFATAYEATEGTDLILLTQSAMIGANLGAARQVPVMHVFTMPWSATKDFPHPFLVPEKDKGPAYNLSTWKLIENGMGAGTLLKINEFRKAHKLPPTWPQGPVDYTRIPTLYCFSPSLVPKPADWPEHTHNTGFYFLDNPDLGWAPPEDLLEFLNRKDGKKCVYIGFGSIVVQDPEGMSRAIIAAVEKAGARAIVSEGWSARGKEKKDGGRGSTTAPTSSSSSSVPPALPPRATTTSEPSTFPATMTLAERTTDFLYSQQGEPLSNFEVYTGLYQLLSDYSRLSLGSGKAADGPVSPGSLTPEQVAAINSQPLANQTVPIRGALLTPTLSSKSHTGKNKKEAPGPIVWPDTIYKVKAIPHDWLFPRLDGVVHHGGAGSTAAGLRAGCPTVIKPFFGDQSYWGMAVERQGLGVVVKELEPESLADALIKITTDPGMRARAQAVGEKLRAEDGTERAADLIESEFEYARNLMEDLLVGDFEKEQLREQRKALVQELRGKRKQMAEERAKLEAKLKAQGLSKLEVDAAVKETLMKSMSFDLGDDGDDDSDDGDDLMRSMTEISISDSKNSGTGPMSSLARKTGQGLIKATVLGAGLVTTGQVFGLQVAKNAWSLVVGDRGKKKKTTTTTTEQQP